MKSRFYLMYIICLLYSPLTFAEYVEICSDSTKQKGNESIEEVVSITGKSNSNVVYFKLLIKNEKKASVYSMVKEFKNGMFESVQVQYGVPNSINTPIMYTFRDPEAPEEDCTYALYRISDGSEVMQKWKFNSDSGELKELPSELAVLKE